MICIAHDDAYSKAVEWLTERPHKIRGAWDCPSASGSLGSLFRMASRSGRCSIPDNQTGLVGCLTMVRGTRYVAQTEGLTNVIRADKRVPLSGDDINVSDLEVFADWQRYLDDVLDRERPVWTDPELVEVAT